MTQFISKLAVSFAADKFKVKYGISATTSCKALETFSSIGTSILSCCIVIYLDCTRPGLALFLVALLGAIFAGEVAGAFTATLFIAPCFTGLFNVRV